MRIRRSRLGILTSGGDCAGLNPAIKWVVKTALDTRLVKERRVTFEIVGIREGWRGIADIDARSEEHVTIHCPTR